jgi:hypothetical protein
MSIEMKPRVITNNEQQQASKVSVHRALVALISFQLGIACVLFSLRVHGTMFCIESQDQLRYSV